MGEKENSGTVEIKPKLEGNTTISHTEKVNDENYNVPKNRRTSSAGSSTNGATTGLTLEQKKTNHIMSENRRRNQIRSSFDRLVQLVPQLEESESRSEYAVLQKTADYIIQLRQENERLENLKHQRGL